MLARVPIRIRLALGFAVTMAIVLGGIGAFVYERTEADLDRQIERELDARIAGVVAIVRDDGDDLGDPIRAPLERVDSEGAVQVLRLPRDVADATSEAITEEPLVPGRDLRELRTGALDHVDVDSPLGPLRVVGRRTQDDGVGYLALAGASLEERNQALASLSRLLLIGGPIALLLASLAAYAVASAALRPVEEMRRTAARISADEPGGRLPVPPADDELSRLGATLNALLVRLESTLARERRFVGDASHELRTPLAILRSQIDLALDAGRSPAELRAALASCGQEVDRLIGLANDLLVLARADEDGIALAPEEVDVAELSHRVLAPRGQAGTTVEVPPGLTVHADPARLEQALSNLVDNALLHGEPPVTVGAAAHDGSVELIVRDAGDGFDEGMRDRATERFARGSRARTKPGSGLGLAIVEAIASAHGGSVRIGSTARGGAEVALVIPRARPEPSDRRKP